MKSSTFKKGFKAVREEQKRREKLREEQRGKLWRIFFPKGVDEDYEIPVVFLSSQPICYYEHSIRVNEKIVNRPCIGDGCKYCESGNKPRYVGAFLVLDKRPYEIEERDSSGNKTGKKILVESSVKLLVRGQSDLAQLDRLNTKYGLEGIEWSIIKTGTGTSTKWNFDRGERVDELTEEELQNILPEHLRGKDIDDIICEQLLPSDEEEEEEEESEELEEDLDSGVQSIDEEDEEEAPTKKSKRVVRKKVHSRKRVVKSIKAPSKRK